MFDVGFGGHMNRRNVIVLVVAALVGLLAVFLVNAWFSGREKQQSVAVTPTAVTKVVVARQPLAFAAPLTPANLSVVDWPASSVPPGAFTTIEDATRNGRVALRPIEVGEPILRSRASADDGRGAVSNNIPENMRAVAIPISAVSGAGGFVTPGDVVDVLMTREFGESQATNVVLENVQVLAIDLVANERANQPKVGNTATVLTDLYGAQKLVLANQVGSLSLALRNIKDQDAVAKRTVTLRDIGARVGVSRSAPSAPVSQPVAASPPSQQVIRLPSGPSMAITRGTDTTVYQVQRYGSR